MTTSTRGATHRRDHGRRHSYLLDGTTVMGVTEIISKGFPKPALTAWAATQTATFVADNLAMLQGRSRDEIIDFCKGSPFRERDRAAGRGTEIHKLARALTEDREVDVPEELLGHVDAHLDFLRRWQPHDDRVELSVYSRRWRYAGTLDWLTKIPGLGQCLIDIKTNKSGPFADTALQLAAYAHADFWIDDQRREQPLPRVDTFAVLWLRSDGCDLYPYNVTEEDFRMFLYCQRIAEWQAERADPRGKRPVRGDAVPWPESKQGVS